MFSVGIDMIEIARIEKSMQNSGFLNRILGEEEYVQLEGKNFPKQSVAANFCAKEAFAKAIGTGFRGFGFREVQVLRDVLGKPYFKLLGSALRICEENNYEFSLSMTHTKEYASAVVICMKK